MVVVLDKEKAVTEAREEVMQAERMEASVAAGGVLEMEEAVTEVRAEVQQAERKEAKSVVDMALGKVSTVLVVLEAAVARAAASH